MADQQSKNKYRSSFGATILFSGVQFYQILIRIVKSKFVALFIGPAGMGINSLLHSTAELISASTNLGLKTSGVKSVAASHAENDREKITQTITVLRRLILLTGLLGMAICAVLAPLWSQVSFGNSDFIWPFVIASGLILFEQLNNGELVLLQGMQQNKMLARANIIGQTISLLFTVPLYYFFGIKAVAWVLLLSAITTYTISKIYSAKLHIGTASVSWKETFSIGGEMIKLGFFLSLQFLLQQAVMYLIRNYVSHIGGVEDVGLYSAGTSIVTTYLGLVFTAIATDYFPRLAASKSNAEMKDAVNTQAEISLLLFAPLVVGFIVFIKPIIVLLYSEKFLPIEHMMYWAVGAVLLQTMGWAISYTLLAKAKPSQFFWNEVGAKLYNVPLCLLGYKYMGLTGFGIASFLTFGLFMIQCIIVSKRLFGFTYKRSNWILLVLAFIPVLLSVALKFAVSEMWTYIIGGLLLAGVSAASLYLLNKRMDLLTVVKRKFLHNKQM